jgi:hypothetical protein
MCISEPKFAKSADNTEGAMIRFSILQRYENNLLRYISNGIPINFIE